VNTTRLSLPHYLIVYCTPQVKSQPVCYKGFTATQWGLWPIRTGAASDTRSADTHDCESVTVDGPCMMAVRLKGLGGSRPPFVTVSMVSW
jgi:hypothetical protein